MRNSTLCYFPKKESAWKQEDVSSSGLSKEYSLTNSTNKDERWKRGRRCSMTRSLNIPVTNETVWNVVTEIASKSHVLKEQIKTQLMSVKSQSVSDLKTLVRNLQKTKKQYMQERADLETALTKIDTDRVMKRISAKQTKDIKVNIKKELDAVNKQIDEIDAKLQDNTNQQKWIDWVGQFKKTYANVGKFNETEQKAYLQGLVDRIDVRLDDKTNEHILDIKFQFPVVNDRYIAQSNKIGSKYEIKSGKYVKSIKGSFASKHFGRDGVKEGEKTKKVFNQSDLKHVLWNWECHRGIVGFGGKSSTKSHTEIYLIFHLKVRASHLWVAPYNEYQQFLFDTITDFRFKGWYFQQIADWLNENDYLTPRGKSFRNAHAHSIVKKKGIREVRLNKMYEPEICDFSLRFVDTTLIEECQ